MNRPSIKVAIGLLLGFAIGVLCRLAGIPLPAPPALVGALLVLSMTSGYLLVDRFAAARRSTTRALCGGPTGEPPSRAPAARDPGP